GVAAARPGPHRVRRPHAAGEPRPAAAGVPGGTMTVDGRTLRRVLRSHAAGVAVLTAPGPVGVTVTSFTSLSADPPLVSFALADTESVVLFTTPKAVAGSEAELAEHFPRHRLVEDYHGWAALRAAESAAREHGVDLVASTSEHDVLRAARLRERLGLPGQGVAS